MDENLILGRYRPLAELGAGGHGSVVRAFDTKMARRVAIKRLALAHGRDGRPLERTGLAEARTAALLNHPNIVTVHEWDLEGGDALIVMEDVGGLSLADILDETGGPLSADEAAAVLEGVSAALEHAHDNGVLHLDLKPGNVLVTPHGRVKVADFGISALTDAAGRAHGISGTIGYMPPEQLRAQPLDVRTDVWSLAVLMYELVAFANPFDSDTVEGSLFKIEVADVPPPSAFDRRVPAGLDAVLLDALAPEPDDRPGSAAELADALDPWLGDPAAGRASLAEIVSAAVSDESEEPDDGPVGLWWRMLPWSGAMTRAGAGAASAWLAWAGLSALGLDRVATIGGAALAALGGVLAPGLGLALGLGSFAIGAGASAGWVAGAGMGVGAGVLWAWRGRSGAADALAPILAPLLALVRAPLAVPLALGLSTTPGVAAGVAAISAVAVMSASALGGGAAPLLGVPSRFLLDPLTAAVPSTWDPATIVAPLAWAVAAALCSTLAARGGRAWAAAGVIAGAGVLAVGYAGAALLAASPVAATAYAPELVIGTAAALAVVALGEPVRPEDIEPED